MKKILYTLSVFFFMLNSAGAQSNQPMRFSVPGTAVIFAIQNDTALRAVSKQVITVSDQVEDKFIIKFDLKDFLISGTNTALIDFLGPELGFRFEGRAGEKVNLGRSGHGSGPFIIDGVAELNGVKLPFQMNGETTHVGISESLSKRMSLDFALDLEKFELEEKLLGFFPVMHVEIIFMPTVVRP